MCQEPQNLELIHISQLLTRKENAVSLPNKVSYTLLQTLLVNFTFKESTCNEETATVRKKNEPSSVNRTDHRAGEPEVFQTDPLFWQEKLKPRAGELAPPLPTVRALMPGSVAQTEHIPWGWRVGQGPAAVKHHSCILQQGRMSGTNSMCLVLRTDFSSFHYSSSQKSRLYSVCPPTVELLITVPHS